jgi:F0F1-type ATP synthase assembly protein I
VTLTNEPSDAEKKQQAEYDRLLHRRKGISGTEFAGVGLQFAVTLVVFALAGIWLDRRLGTSPWLLIVGVLGGAGLGLWTMIRKLTIKK